MSNDHNACDCLACVDDRSFEEKLNDARFLIDGAIADGLISADLREFYLGAAFADSEGTAITTTLLSLSLPERVVTREEIARRFIGTFGSLGADDRATSWAGLPPGMIDLEVGGDGLCVVERSWDDGATPVPACEGGDVKLFGNGNFQMANREVGVLWRVRRIDEGPDPIFVRLQAA